MRFFPNRPNQLITPEIAGWEYSGLAIFELSPGTFAVPASITAGNEAALIPLRGKSIKVNVDGEQFELQGRDGVFAGATDWIYVKTGAVVSITTTTPIEIAIATARADSDFPTVYVSKIQEVEIRGAGSATREVRPFMHPDIFPDAMRLNAVEVVTPDGNTSSYPPHRHDGIAGCPFHNEEIYYFRIGDGRSAHGSDRGFGMHRTYSAPEDSVNFDDNIAVHDGDIYLVDRGYHGPCAAMPGFPMYYLNVLAGPGANRTMGFCDDPKYADIRDSWKKELPDPRVPWRISQ
ncbi:MAG: 5-deoxy-glucuronate isomerase [Actinomycetota bacterium]|jgi:5-deoxy-glucuronate isomerase